MFARLVEAGVNLIVSAVGQVSERKLDGGLPYQKYYETTQLAIYRQEIARLRRTGLMLDEIEPLERFVVDNIDILRRPSTKLCHGDFGPENLIARHGKLVGIVDFNMASPGHPEDDLSPLPLIRARFGNSYAIGELRGYVEADPSPEFWWRYNFYFALHFPRRLEFASRKFGSNLGFWISAARSIIDDHDFDFGGPPRWWAESEHPSPVL